MKQLKKLSPPHSLEKQIEFVKGGIDVLENSKKEAEIILDKDNLEMLRAIEQSLGELKLHE